MLLLLTLLILVLCLTVLFLANKNRKLKKSHAENIARLESIILSLNKKQQELSTKVLITSEYDAHYRNDMKSLGDEVLELQKIFISILSNKNSD